MILGLRSNGTENPIEHQDANTILQNWPAISSQPINI
jgi:hypothetical protein